MEYICLYVLITYMIKIHMLKIHIILHTSLEYSHFVLTIKVVSCWSLNMNEKIIMVIFIWQNFVVVNVNEILDFFIRNFTKKLGLS